MGRRATRGLSAGPAQGALTRAIERSPFHARRLRGVDPGRFELADLARLPVMTKTQMMENFDTVITDRRLTREVVERHLARAVAEPSLLLGDYVSLVSGGSSGLRPSWPGSSGKAGCG
jgi:phenylacetate-CoA ligase